MQKAKFLIFCMIFVGSAAFGQQKSTPRVRYMVVDTGYQPNCWGNKFQNYYRKPKADTSCFQRPGLPFSFLPANFYSSNLGFFCRQEIRFEKKTGLPFKFRLGSVGECDRLEGKGGR